ncbi:MAG TPA: ZIP family metal transporter [Candidatus Limnocylindria bacterium]|nr:ZIP family metal transporter [Candidatus Limnocylindria bacterium]
MQVGVALSTWLAIGFAGIAFFSTVAGGFAALRWPGRVQALAALAGGIVLGAAFFDLLPEAIARAAEINLSAQIPVGACLVGFLAFYTLERFLHHHHEESEAPDRAGLIGASGFVVHSVFDGLAIGLGFRVDSALGLLVAAAVIGHDFSDGLNTVSYMITHRQTAGRSRALLVADALAPILGALFASFVPVPDQVFPIAIGFFSGLFIYAASSTLLPRAKELAPATGLLLTIGGAAAMFFITRLA